MIAKSSVTQKFKKSTKSGIISVVTFLETFFCSRTNFDKETYDSLALTRTPNRFHDAQ